MTPPLRSAAQAASAHPRQIVSMLLVVFAMLAACTKVKPPEISYDDAAPWPRR